MAVVDKLTLQEARRSKALEEQKRRRAQRIDSTRQLDIFAGLSLGASDDDEPEEEQNVKLALGSVASYAPLLSNSDCYPEKIIQAEHACANTSTNPNINVLDTDEKRKKRKKKNNNQHNPQNKRRGNKQSNKWVDQCMYAELLEMSADDPWDMSFDCEGAIPQDGLPIDLESGWIAVAPVPTGKRCLAVTHQSAGVSGIVSNTTLRSRLLGKSLLARFPSSLPYLTVLDCILDARWRENGILHVLDVVRWKGQDVADCEAKFRFWWRDTRLAELDESPPPTLQFISIGEGKQKGKYHFPYPTAFIPVPYHANTTLLELDTRVIPAAREIREIVVRVPSLSCQTNDRETGMEVEENSDNNEERRLVSTSEDPLDVFISRIGPSQVNPISFDSLPARIQPDGMLLYVAEASYEHGTSPLSGWIPICGYNGDEKNRRSALEEGPLTLFHRLVRKRLAGRYGQGENHVGSVEADMDIE